MAKVRLTKQFGFEAAHSLYKYDGLCKNIHGHSYILFVTVIGDPIADENDVKNGMVMDFGDLKRIVKSEIVDVYDHSYVINKKADVSPLLQLTDMFDRHIIVDYQPTCENMVIDFADKIMKKLPAHVKLHSIKLHETANSYAEWFASDNE